MYLDLCCHGDAVQRIDVRLQTAGAGGKERLQQRLFCSWDGGVEGAEPRVRGGVQDLHGGRGDDGLVARDVPQESSLTLKRLLRSWREGEGRGGRGTSYER